MTVSALIARLQGVSSHANVFMVDAEFRPWMLAPEMVIAEADLMSKEHAILDSEAPFLLVADIGSPVPCRK